MDEVLAAVRGVQRRAMLIHIAGTGTLLLGLAAALLAVAVGADRLLALQIPLWGLAGVLAGLALAGTLAVALALRPRPVTAALLADHALGLDTRLSSALLLSGSADAMARAAILDAREHALSVDPRRVLPHKAQRFRKVLLYSTAALLLAFLTPRLDLLSLQEERDRIAEEERTVAAITERLTRSLERVETRARRLELAAAVPELRSLREAAERLSQPRPDRRAALSSLENLRDRIADRSRALEAKGRRPDGRLGSETADRLANALSRRDADSARRELESLKRKLEDEVLSPEERSELARSLEKLAKSLGADEAMGKALQELAASLEGDRGASFDEALALTRQELARLEQVFREQELLGEALREVARATRDLGSAALCPDCLRGDCAGGKPGGT
jgi:hypothetical protein